MKFFLWQKKFLKKMTEMNLELNASPEFAAVADANDPLKHFRERFYIDDQDTIYLDGNSLGRLPQRTKALITEVTEKQWGKALIESWNQHWYEMPARLGDKIAQIIGARPGEVIVSDSTSVNLYKLVYAALNYQTGKTMVVSDVFNFPTDLYIIQGILNEKGPDYKMVLAESKDGISVDMQDLNEKITENTALVVLSLVTFKSSFLYQAEKVSEWAHQKGALVLWDLSHAAGAVPVELSKTGADLAVGCSYKYLNGGPGAPAFLFVRKELQEKLFSPVQGWFGHQQPFQFNLDFSPAQGIRKFLAGTPPVLSLMATEPGLDLLIEAGIENLRTKSVMQTEYFLFLLKEKLEKFGFVSGTPSEPQSRGSHISLKHKEGYRICQALIHPKNGTVKVIPDFREPDNIRFGITPLYTTFTEIRKTVLRLSEIMEKKEYQLFPKERKAVT
jgi:kynureninase